MSNSFDQTTTDTGDTDNGKATATILDGKIVVGDRVYDPEALATKLEAADAHIAKLEGENATHVEKGTALLDRLEKLEDAAGDNSAVSELLETLKNQDNNSEGSGDSAISKEELTQTITQEIRDSLKADEVEARQDQNFTEAVRKAREVYGAEFGEKVDAIGLENDMQPEEVIDLARNNPKAWEKLFLPANTERKPDTTGSSVNASQQSAAESNRSAGYLKMRSSKDQRTEFARRMAEAEAKYK